MDSTETEIFEALLQNKQVGDVLAMIVTIQHEYLDSCGAAVCENTGSLTARSTLSVTVSRSCEKHKRRRVVLLSL